MIYLIVLVGEGYGLLKERLIRFGMFILRGGEIFFLGGVFICRGGECFFDSLCFLFIGIIR